MQNNTYIYVDVLVMHAHCTHIINIMHNLMYDKRHTPNTQTCIIW